jgi:hypothetical protein
MLNQGQLGAITPNLKKLQARYLEGQIDSQEFLFQADAEIKKIDREKGGD